MGWSSHWRKARSPVGAAAAVGALVGALILLLGVVDLLFEAGFEKTTTSIFLGFLSAPSRLWLQVAGFLLAFLLLHAAFASVVFELPRSFLAVVIPDHVRMRRAQLLVALTATLSVLLLNARVFPHSAYGHALADLMDSTAAFVVVVLMGSASLVVVGLGTAMRIVAMLKRRPREARSPWFLLLVPLALVIGGSFALAGQEPDPRTTFPERPNVVLVGVDGWRLDAAPLTGGNPGLMPFMDSLFSQSAVIAEAYTPHARTYPAWMSILTGKEPPDHGARFNLIADEHLAPGVTLVELLGELGYYSVFAMDERRFANIGTHHGFDREVGPPVGAADFLLGAWGDSPLTNLVVNTVVGRLLFPFSHGNRAAASTYRPATFDRALARAVRAAPDQPLFLAVHFELPHWPYVWGERTTRQFADDSVRGPGGYLATLARVDEQVRELFRALDQEGFLDHAVIAVFSDHGESFASQKVGFKNTNTGRLRQERYGHGTDVLSLSQYQVPLALLRNGPSKRVTPGLRPIRGSLVDLFPTVAEWVGFEVPAGVTGLSLVRELETPSRATWDRPLSLETGFTLPALLGPDVDERQLLDEGAAYYDLKRDGRLTLRGDRLSELLSEKQRAVLLDRWILAAIPGAGGQGVPQLLLADLRSQEYIDLSDGVLPGAPVGELLGHFCERFSGEVRPLFLDPPPMWVQPGLLAQRC